MIKEHGISYQIDFSTSHKGGFFCDQRDNRRRLGQLVQQGHEVLDLCSYTGGFSLNAKIHGKAKHVTSVDLDPDVIGQLRKNATLNNAAKIETHALNMFPFAREMQKRKRRWNVVILDPPKLVPDFSAMADGLQRYEDMNREALPLVADGGIFVTCSCSGCEYISLFSQDLLSPGLVSPDQFEQAVFSAARAAGKTIQIFNRTGAAPDHPEMSDCPQSRYLKVLWTTVSSI